MQILLHCFRIQHLPDFIFNSRIKSSGLLNNFKFLYIWNSLSSIFEAFANYVGQDTYITF